MSKVGDYFFEFPASRGMQGSTATYMITAPARALTRILASDNHGSTLERSQREINQARVKKFYQYLVMHTKIKSPSSSRRWSATATRILSLKSSAIRMWAWHASLWMR